MGITLSTHSTLAPLSLASTIIGFVSFSFTIATLLRVFWGNITTVTNAHDEIHDYLSNLRVQLYEERESLRNLRRHNKDWGKRRRSEGLPLPRLDDLTIRSMQDTLRHLTRRFKTLERAFLDQESAYGRRRYRKSLSPNPRDTLDSEKGLCSKETELDKENDDDEEDPRTQGDAFCNITLGKRILWLRRRSDALAIMEAVSRLQTRRTARQVGEIAVALYEYGDTVKDLHDGLHEVEARFCKIAGIRTVT
ncbi:hypothetical protein AUEXF2481DRAFT_26793 [Aureobasidium subglaciale EXF-2481]|uniref:Uncharacterized protein n=1 Tax=Aureobasidium subglaciale (strain EXF-2481) TaxID=1043005 RepID=A0A074YL50_AURSE|nr:uncharacterized protein AUEXF2481DRAFT_26793 [Aureobasidium subglaciale EXF-2481]KAI5211920.1 hypothetical protein E4T38_00946 [Aureobasidium subglaciale]KAI5230809.1 hypothetical protein E4T40_00947 [Aureobasidium subglaciale]KAI5233785.1 hypothetical protein E4T41_00945 [Aureobasidium subglaciale]KAI5267241.1 hypothetical protein E4T46_00945 [Aureobasidium subglaciale]KEQ98415.1 hypothetical protein AUEXF2481DRAFT_26793 [Aureobasidium subglaciale EXF-2481]